ncbi:hypothetical protein JTE90_015736 [Oedothorax gibbosus]|uniref:Reverse transcriptase domain-containing protein n=1 Tax=Oedothorax gibbosus TaxID=931172 RepID=A0AAV6U0Q1_9ARAC|nr:hypothetical protein JTE90_015736 [Oedothorax gibbosus]
MIFHFINALIEAAPANKTSPYHLLDEAWTTYRTNFNLTLLSANIAHFLDVALPSKKGPKQSASTLRPTVNMSKREARRQEYATTQKLFKKSPKRVVEKILDPVGVASFPDSSHFRSFWDTAMSLPPNAATPSLHPGVLEPPTDFSGLWDPIPDEEILKSFPDGRAAPGQDGLRTKDLRRLPPFVLTKLLNALLYTGLLPPRLTVSRTIFFPKNDQASNPGDFRPISMSSIISRLFHKILASRLSSRVNISDEQRAFKPTDGASQNIFLLDLVLNNAKINRRETHIASIHLAKAFDSVSHESIFAAANAVGLPEELQDYTRHLYAECTTIFDFPGSSSVPFHPTCGVRQGDPLSPLLFFLIKRLRNFIGVDIGGIHLGLSAFADDLLIFAGTSTGLQFQVTKAAEFLATCKLHINSAKSFTLSLVPDGRNNKMKIEVPGTILNGITIRALRPGEEFKYLVVYFRTDGLLFFSPICRIQEWLSKLARAPLKPQQRLLIIRDFLLPRILHLSVLSRVRIGVMTKTDRAVRGFVRKHLNLPHDAANAFIHGNISDGCLGIPALRVIVPELRLKRLNNIKKYFSDLATNSFPLDFLMCHIHRAINAAVPGSPKTYWCHKLHSSVDGVGLQESSSVPGQHNWMAGRTLFLSGRDFIQCVKLRFNCLPCRSKCARGRPEKERLCGSGCNRNESLAHILQGFPRTHGHRINCHNAIASYLCRGLELRNFTVHQEPRFSSSIGTLKPDLVALKNNTAYIIDAQVVSDSEPQRRAHLRKLDKYSELIPLVSATHNVAEVHVHSATLNWRGVWCPESASSLLEDGLVRKGDLLVLSSRVIIGGVSCYNFFARSTARSWPRGGHHQR